MSDVDITIGSDTSAAAAGFAELQNYAEKARADITRSFAGSIAVSVIATGITTGIQSVIEYGAKVYDLAQRFAVSTTAIQEFGNVAERSGSSLEGVAMGFNKLDIATSKALGGNQSVIDAFARLGVSVDDLKNLSPEEIMLKIGHSSMDAADMVTILGRTGTQLRETLRKLADGTDEFGNAIDPGLIQKLKLADDRFKIFWQNVRIYGAVALDFIAQRSADVFDFLIPSFVQKWIGFGSLPQKPPPSPGRAHVPPEGGTQPTGPEGVPFDDEGEGGGAGTIGDLSARAASSGGGRGSGRGGGGITDEVSLRQKIDKIEEESAARNRTDEEQLVELQKQRVDLAQTYQAASKASGFIDTKASLDAELALKKNQQEVDKLSGKIEDDKAAAVKKITDEREKEAAQAEKELADAQESNKELQLTLAGHEDLAKRVGIQYDYEQKIAEAKKQLYYDEEQARQAAERGDLAERDKWDAVAGTNRALVEQLSLEEQNALAAHDKAQAEKEAAAVAEVADRTKAVQQTNEELAASIGGHRDLYEFLKKEGDLQLQIDQAIKDANQYWSEGRFLLAQQNTDLAKALGLTQQLLTAARQLADTRGANDVAQQTIALRLDESHQSATAASLNYQYEMNKKILAAQQAGYTATAAALIAERDLHQQTVDIPAVQRQGTGITPGTDATARAFASGITGVGYSDLAMIMATDPSTGKVNEAELARYRALEMLNQVRAGSGSLGLRPAAEQTFSVVAVLGRQKLLSEFYAKQQRQQDQLKHAQLGALDDYYSSIYSGLDPAKALTTLWGSAAFAGGTDLTGLAPRVLPGGAPATPGGASGVGGPSLAQFTQLQHETAIQRITGSIPGLLSGSIPRLPSTSGTNAASTVTRLEQTVLLLQQSLAKLTSIDGRLKPIAGSH